MIRVHIRQRPDRPGFQAFWNDPFTERRKTKTLQAERRKDAEKEAAVLESQLRARIEPESSPTSWDDFRLRFNEEYLPSRAKLTRNSYRLALDQFEKAMGHPDLQHVNESLLSQYQTALRKRKLRDTTIATYLRHLKAALTWAARIRLMTRVPSVEMPRVYSSQLGKGRPITDDEFDRMKRVVQQLHAKNRQLADSLTRLLDCLWLSGLRLGEACALSWDSPPVRVDLESGKFARIYWSASGQKSRKDEVNPLTPDFAEWLSKTPKRDRHGPIVPVVIKGHAIQQDRIGKLISALGKAAKIKTGDRFATAHDLRRSFATRWSRRVRPVTLRAIMRHRDVKTTLSYYVDFEADDIGAELAGIQLK